MAITLLGVVLTATGIIGQIGFAVRKKNDSTLTMPSSAAILMAAHIVGGCILMAAGHF